MTTSDAALIGRSISEMQRLRDAGYSTRDIANRIDVSKSAVHRYLTGQRLPTVDIAQRAVQSMAKAPERAVITDDFRGLGAVELVGRSSQERHTRWYDAMQRAARGDWSKFDALTKRDLTIKIRGASGKVERYTLAKDKDDLRRFIQQGQLDEIKALGEATYERRAKLVRRNAA